MCGRVIQSSGPVRYATVDGMNVRDSRVHNYPPRWNAAPSQELLVIRRNHRTGEVSLDPLRWGLIPYLCTVLSCGAAVPSALVARFEAKNNSVASCFTFPSLFSFRKVDTKIKMMLLKQCE
jgi:putative SOS response-associated peptidase YedK